jgi:hypothetical protein
MVKTPVRKRAGQRRHRVTLQVSTTVLTTLGGQQDGEFTTFGHDHASIDEIPFIVNATEHGILADLTIRYRADIVSQFEADNKRVRILGPDEKVYTLLEIENPERRNIELILHCAPAG